LNKDTEAQQTPVRDNDNEPNKRQWAKQSQGMVEKFARQFTFKRGG